jgi:N-acetylglucosamine-6-phosphate deacetylase
MFDSTVILNARLSQRPGFYRIVTKDNWLQSIEPMAKETAMSSAKVVIDVKGDWISLGALDLQINGALGLAFPDLRQVHFEQLRAICKLLWQQGVDGFCPTIVTTSLDNFHGSLAAICEFQKLPAEPSSAQVLGAHLEGPFLNPAKRGAHPAEFLQPLTLANVKAVIDEFAEAISIVTLAPELAVDEAVIDWLTSRNITVSLGHSLATAQQASLAFAQGATMVTHAFNAMPGLHHRDPGLLGAALADSRVFGGLIADGQHVCPTMLDLLLRMGRGSLTRQTGGLFLGGLFLVSDALSPYGLPDGVYPWDERQIEVVEGAARIVKDPLAAGTLAGTTLPLIEGAQNLVKWGLCSVEEAIALVTQTPRQAIGIPDLAIHAPASLLRWHHDIATGELTWQRLTAPNVIES